MIVPPSNIGEVSCAKASSEQFTFVASKRFHWEIFLLEGEINRNYQNTSFVSQPIIC